MDIVAQLRNGADDMDANLVMQSAADTIEFLRTEVARLSRPSDSPVHGPELKRSLLAEGRYRAPECGGFQGFED